MRRDSAGFSLVEVVIAMSIMAIALFGMISVITYSSRNNAVARERMLAIRAAEKQIETMKVMATSGALNVIFNTYTTAGKSTFDVYQDNDLTLTTGIPALTPSPTGKILFPADTSTPPKLLETLTGAFLGRYDPVTFAPLNIDLDQSGAIENTDKSTSPNLGALPVKVTVSWKGVAGPGEVTIFYVFSK